VLAHEVTGERIGDDGLHLHADFDAQPALSHVVDEEKPSAIQILSHAHLPRHANAELFQRLSLDRRDEEEADVHARFILDHLEKALEAPFVGKAYHAGLVAHAVGGDHRRVVADLGSPPLGRHELEADADHQDQAGPLPPGPRKDSHSADLGTHRDAPRVV
jgi:hypothetical protein